MSEAGENQRARASFGRGSPHGRTPNVGTTVPDYCYGYCRCYHTLQPDTPSPALPLRREARGVLNAEMQHGRDARCGAHSGQRPAAAWLHLGRTDERAAESDPYGVVDLEGTDDVA